MQKWLRHSHPTAALHEFWQRRTQAEQPPPTEPGFVSCHSSPRHFSRPPSCRNANLPSKGRKNESGQPLGKSGWGLLESASTQPSLHAYTQLVSLDCIPFHSVLISSAVSLRAIRSLPSLSSCYRSFAMMWTSLAYYR